MLFSPNVALLEAIFLFRCLLWSQFQGTYHKSLVLAKNNDEWERTVLKNHVGNCFRRHRLIRGRKGVPVRDAIILLVLLKQDHGC